MTANKKSASKRVSEKRGSCKGAPGCALGANSSRAASLVGLAPPSLSPLEHRFCQEYLVDLNGTKAYQRASPQCSANSARTCAARMLASANVANEIQRLMDGRAAITGVTANRVLMRLWQMATADARKLIEYRVGSCRHCCGMYNQYHYTEAEFSSAQHQHIREQAARGRKEKEFEPAAFPEKGGPGYDPNRPPNPECPECWGRGKGEPIIHDTRDLEDGEAMMYAGMKITKDGVNVAMHSPFEALQLIGRHLGMWNDKVKIGGDAENPLMLLIQQIQQSHSTLPIVHDDPELKPRQEVQDVTAKPAPGTAPGAVLQRKPVKDGGWKPV